MNKSTVADPQEGLFGLKKETLTNVTAWMKPKDAVLNETSQPHRDKHHGFHLQEVSRAVQSTEQAEWWKPGTGGRVVC